MNHLRLSNHAILMGLIGLIGLGAAATLSAMEDQESICRIAQIYVDGGWCDRDEVGYFDGTPIKSRKLWEALQGKYTSTYGMTNENCIAAFKADEWCDDLNVGYCVYKVYKSRVAHKIVQGRSVDPATIKCDEFKDNDNRFGWCSDQEFGLVGCAKFKDKDKYNQAVAMRKILDKAIKLSETDEACAVEMVILAKDDIDCDTIDRDSANNEESGDAEASKEEPE